MIRDLPDVAIEMLIALHNETSEPMPVDLFFEAVERGIPL